MEGLQIHENNPDHLEEFIALNEAWISHYFSIEDSDRALAADPAKVWRNGGYIFTGVLDQKVVGCCALFFKEPGFYELARMAVHIDFRGKGIGRIMANHAMEKLNEIEAEKVELLSNTKLEPAIALYSSLGFETTSLCQHPIYSRCDIVMTKQLSSPAK